MLNRISITLAFLFLTTLQIFGQGEDDPKTMAQEYLKLAQEMQAGSQALVDIRDVYVLAAMTDPENIIANFQAGELYLQTVGKDQAVQYFERVKELNKDYRFDIDYKIGRSFHFGQQFDKALEYYNTYKAKLMAQEGYRGEDKVELKEVNQRIAECENAIELVANPAHVTIKNLGNTINTEYEDYSPVLNAEEDMMIFTSRRKDDNMNQNVFEDNKPYEDIFIAYKKGGRWDYAKNIGIPINHKYHNSNLALSKDGKQLFVYTDDGNGDILVSTHVKDTVWTEPVTIGDNVNSKGFKESSISISPDGNVLYFASNRPAGMGGSDIYYSIKDENGEWARAKNLSQVINTEFDEDGPFIDYDGKTLYFSSKGHKGMGGYDIFKSEYDSTEQVWSTPVNIGYPINTPDDDVFFVSTADGKRGYYASVREDGLGYTDIYTVILPTDEEPKKEDPIAKEEPEETNKEEPKEQPKELQPVTIAVKVVDATTNEPLEAKVSLKNAKDNTMAGMRKGGDGLFNFTINSKESGTYNLSVEMSGYIFETSDIPVPAMSSEARNISRTIKMRKPVVNSRKVLKNIYFDFNKATFKQVS
ncbi:MAG: hypothetical protein OEY34_09140, partial [Cyclobacteriaceae bacterium]|nr:hypothetical protein [Cyclobacteriaceae bacterium]